MRLLLLQNFLTQCTLFNLTFLHHFILPRNLGKHVPGGLQSIEHVFCPFNGRFRFAYSANGGQQNCDMGYSEMSNCPHGNALNVKFRKCTFPTTGKLS